MPVVGLFLGLLLAAVGFSITLFVGLGLGSVLVLLGYAALLSGILLVFFKLPILAKCRKNGIQVDALEVGRRVEVRQVRDHESRQYDTFKTTIVHLRTCRHPIDFGGGGQTNCDWSLTEWEGKIKYDGPKKVHKITILPRAMLPAGVGGGLETGYDFGIKTERCNPGVFRCVRELATVLAKLLVFVATFALHFWLAFYVNDTFGPKARLTLVVLGLSLPVPLLREAHLHLQRPAYLKKHRWKQVPVDRSTLVAATEHEAATIIELALWKNKIDETDDSGGGTREGCRWNCGADPIIPGVLSFL